MPLSRTFSETRTENEPRTGCAVKSAGAQGRDRTTDTAIFNRMLYQLSYLGARRPTGNRRLAAEPCRAPRYKPARPVRNPSQIPQAFRPSAPRGTDFLITTPSAAPASTRGRLLRLRWRPARRTGHPALELRAASASRPASSVTSTQSAMPAATRHGQQIDGRLRVTRLTAGLAIEAVVEHHDREIGWPLCTPMVASAADAHAAFRHRPLRRRRACRGWASARPRPIIAAPPMAPHR